MENIVLQQAPNYNKTSKKMSSLSPRKISHHHISITKHAPE